VSDNFRSCASSYPLNRLLTFPRTNRFVPWDAGNFFVRLQVLTAPSMKMLAFWDLALFSLVVVDRRFRGVNCLYHQGDEVGTSVINTNNMANIILLPYQPSVWLKTGRQWFDPRQRIFPLGSVSRPGPPSLLFNGYRESILGVKRDRGVALTTRPHLVPRSRMRRSYTPIPLAPPWR
jgi:hypothetical protein